MAWYTQQPVTDCYPTLFIMLTCGVLLVNSTKEPEYDGRAGYDIKLIKYMCTRAFGVGTIGGASAGIIIKYLQS
jgi:hypothetical protein